MMPTAAWRADIEAVHHLVAGGDIGHATEQPIPELHALRLA
jgi:histidine ammonia-lyase